MHLLKQNKTVFSNENGYLLVKENAYKIKSKLDTKRCRDPLILYAKGQLRDKKRLTLGQIVIAGSNQQRSSMTP